MVNMVAFYFHNKALKYTFAYFRVCGLVFPPVLVVTLEWLPDARLLPFKQLPRVCGRVEVPLKLGAISLVNVPLDAVCAESFEYM